MRLDKYLSEKYPQFSRSKIQDLIKTFKVKVNGEVVQKPSFSISDAENVEVKLPEEEVLSLKSEDLNLPVIAESEDFIVINKPASVVVHPDEDGGNMSGTVVNAFLDKLDFPAGFGLRPGVVHRLDKDTSGILLLARNEESLAFFQKQFKDRVVEKTYLALVKGRLEQKEGVIDSPIGRSVRDRKKMAIVSNKEGKEAVSIYKVVEEFEFKAKEFVSLVEVQIKTGRTHQIRVHMAAIGHPVVGDSAYGDRNLNKVFKEDFGLERQFLHAWKLAFNDLDKKKLRFEAELSDDLNSVLKVLKP